MELYPEYPTIEISVRGEGHFEFVSVAQAAEDLHCEPANVNQYARRIYSEGDTKLDHMFMFKGRNSKGLMLIPKNKKYYALMSERAGLRGK